MATNNAPVATSVQVFVSEDDLVSGNFNFIASDPDPGAVLTFSAAPGQGAVAGFSFSSSGPLSFDASVAAYQSLAQGTSTNVLFNYRATDQFGAFSDGTLTLTVVGRNDAPTANPFFGAVFEGVGPTPVNLNTLVSDVDAGTVFSFSAAAGQPPVAGISLASNGILTFDASNPAYDAIAQGGVQAVTFNYTVSDQFGATATSSFNVNVVGVNDAPVAGAAGIVVAAGDPVISGNLNFIATDPDAGAVLSFAPAAGQGPLAGFTLASDGSISFNPGDPAYQSLPAGAVLDLAFNYQVTDEFGASASATFNITINGTNDAPTAVDDAVIADEDAVLMIAGSALTANDTDPDGDTLTVTAVSGAVNGSVSLMGGTISFTPDADYNGPASFEYTVDDGRGGSDTGIVNITVNNVNDAPVAVDDGVFAVVEDTPVMIAGGTLTGNDTDIDVGDTLVVSAVGNAVNGTVSLMGNTVTFTPNANYVGDASFEYTVSDGNGGTDVGLVNLSVSAVNDAPVAVDDVAAVTESGVSPGNTPNLGIVGALGNVLSNDTDVDTPPASLSVTAVNGSGANVGMMIVGTFGTLTINANGSFSYTLDNTDPDTNQLARGAVGQDVFNYTVSDGALSDDGTLTVTVNGANDLPVLTAGPVFSNAGVRFTVTDPDVGDVLRIEPNTFGIADTSVTSGVEKLAIPTPQAIVTTAALVVADGNPAVNPATVIVAALTAGTNGGDTLTLSAPGAAYGFGGGDTLNGTSGADFLFGGEGNDLYNSSGGDDTIEDLSTPADVNTVAGYNLGSDGADRINLGVETAAISVSNGVNTGQDVVNVTAAPGQNQIRVSFISAEVGNGNANDSNGAPGVGQPFNPDGGLAVRLQGDNADVLSGSIGRSDDEGVTFRTTAGTTFDVRDLISGAARGDQFNQVVLGTSQGDTYDFASIPAGAGVNYYVNAGGGADTITGNTGNDFLVGGGGADVLDGGAGTDSYIGGGGDDVINDTTNTTDVNTVAAYNLGTDGADRINLGVETAAITVSNGINTGQDVVNVTAAPGQNQIRVSFISTEVGNGNANDSNGAPGVGQPFNPDGGLAVRLQGDNADVLSGSIGRSDDEGVTFRTTAGTTFDVRDLISGAARGDQFNQVVLGTSQGDSYDFASIPAGAGVNYYVNAGGGADTITGNTGNDFLVGGGGDDVLIGAAGTDSYLGGGGNDRIFASDQDALIDGGADTDRLVFGAGPGSFSFVSASDAQISGIEEFAIFGIDVATMSLVDLSLQTEGFRFITDNTLADTVIGGQGANTFEGTNIQADNLTGGSTNMDLLFIDGAYNDASDGQLNGIERVTMRVATTLNLDQQTEGFFIIGSSGIDTIVAGGGRDIIDGGLGADNINAGMGDDDIVADQNDTANGGDGNDTLLVNASYDDANNARIVNVENIFVNAAGALTLNLASQTEDFVISSIAGNATTLVSGSGADLINLGDGADSINAGGGDDIILADSADTLINGGGGTMDTLRVTAAGFDDVSAAQVANIERVELVDVGANVNLASQTEGFTVTDVALGNNATITTGSGADSINAGDGDDTINAGGGADIVNDGAGNDTVRGGGGADALFSGTGNDRFIFEATGATNGTDTITNFDAAGMIGDNDILDFSLFRAGLTVLDSILGGIDFDAFTANPGVATNINNRIVKLVDIAGGQDIMTAVGLRAALANGGEYAGFDTAAGQGAVILTAATAGATSFNAYYVTGNSNTVGGPAVSLVGVVNIFGGAAFSSITDQHVM